MTPRTIWLLAALLAAGIAVEVLWPQNAAPVAPPAPAAAVALAAPATIEPVADWTATILARPLFEPDRRPKARAAVAAAGPGAQAEPPRLTGILVMPQGNHAIFAGEGDHSTIAGEGAHFGVWQVLAIHRGDVQLAGPDGSRTVKPSYSNPAPGAAPVSAPIAAAPFGALSPPSGEDIFRNAQRALDQQLGNTVRR